MTHRRWFDPPDNDEDGYNYPAGVDREEWRRTHPREQQLVVPEQKEQVGLSPAERKRFDDWYGSSHATPSRPLSLVDRKRLSLAYEVVIKDLKQKAAKLNKESADLKKEKS